MEAAAPPVHLNLFEDCRGGANKCIVFTCARLSLPEFQCNGCCNNHHVFSMKQLVFCFLRTRCAFLSACDPWRVICNPCLSTSPALLISVLKSSEHIRHSARDILMQKASLKHPHVEEPDLALICPLAKHGICI